MFPHPLTQNATAPDSQVTPAPGNAGVMRPSAAMNTPAAPNVKTQSGFTDSQYARKLCGITGHSTRTAEDVLSNQFGEQIKFIREQIRQAFQRGETSAVIAGRFNIECGSKKYFDLQMIGINDVLAKLTKACLDYEKIAHDLGIMREDKAYPIFLEKTKNHLAEVIMFDRHDHSAKSNHFDKFIKDEHSHKQKAWETFKKIEREQSILEKNRAEYKKITLGQSTSDNALEKNQWTKERTRISGYYILNTMWETILPNGCVDAMEEEANHFANTFAYSVKEKLHQVDKQIIIDEIKAGTSVTTLAERFCINKDSDEGETLGKIAAVYVGSERLLTGESIDHVAKTLGLPKNSFGYGELISFAINTDIMFSLAETPDLTPAAIGKQINTDDDYV